jgi:hypothetical protein
LAGQKRDAGLYRPGVTVLEVEGYGALVAVRLHDRREAEPAALEVPPRDLTQLIRYAYRRDVNHSQRERREDGGDRRADPQCPDRRRDLRRQVPGEERRHHEGDKQDDQ